VIRLSKRILSSDYDIPIKEIGYIVIFQNWQFSKPFYRRIYGFYC